MQNNKSLFYNPNTLFFDNFCKKLKNYLANNWPFILYLLILSIITYWVALTHFGLTIDSEFYVDRTSADLLWVRQGRWGMYLLNYVLLPNPVFPFFPLFIALIFTACSFLIVAHILKSNHTRAEYLAAPFFVACPTLYFIYSFSTINFGIGIALFCGAVAIYSLLRASAGRHKIFWSFVAVLIASFSISIYQVMLFWLMALFFLYVLSEIVEGNLSAKTVITLSLIFFGFCVISYLVYVLFQHLAYLVFHTTNSHYSGCEMTIQFTRKYWFNTLGRIFHHLKNAYWGKKMVYGKNIPLLPVLFFSVFLSIAYLIWRNGKNVAAKCIGTCLLFFIPFTPFLLFLLTSGTLPVRVWIAWPLVLSGLTYIAWRGIQLRSMRFLWVILLICCTYSFILIQSKLAFASYLSWQADQALTTRLLARLDAARSVDAFQQGHQAIPLVLSGQYYRQPSEFMLQNDTIGSSFFSWDLGNVNRVISFMHTMGVYEYTPASIKQKNALKPMIEKMPVWPNPGSVVFIHGIAVIKFS